MTKNPIINALSASGYILLVVSIMNFLSSRMHDKPDTGFAPVVFLSLLTLSVTVMSSVFFYQPLMLFVTGKKKEALNLFVRTVGVFAIFTIVVLTLLLIRVV